MIKILLIVGYLATGALLTAAVLNKDVNFLVFACAVFLMIINIKLTELLSEIDYLFPKREFYKLASDETNQSN